MFHYDNIITIFCPCRVLKQALRVSGPNATKRHIEEVSLCTLFLMEAAKKADTECGISPRSAKHTTRDASFDVRKVALHLLEHEVTVHKVSRTTPPFRDVTEDGFAKISQAWLDKVLTNVPDTAEDSTEHNTITDLDYELHHTT